MTHAMFSAMKTLLFPLAVLLTPLAPVFGRDSDSGFTAHEWGTFTSVQGADGVQMDWNPLIVSDLPKFVYDRARSGAKRGLLIAGKTGTMQRQRMETPVIYFYSDEARTVDVSVNFPRGQITEWYPQETAADLGIRTVARAKTVPALRWPKVEILPATEGAKMALPTDPSGSHYFAARETDAALLRVVDGAKKPEVEKFLFYRGVGSFTAPLTVKQDSADAQRVSLTNEGQEELRALFLCEVHADGARWLAVDKLQPGETRVVSLAAAPGADTATLAAALRTALIGDGLYEKEAAAMVKTWETSWLGERGLRVLYTLPRAWTERTLPLAITPAPKTTERVMVGRAEIITPVMEQALLGTAERYLAGPAAERAQVVADTRALGFGRFTEPTLRRVMMAAKRSPEFSACSWELLEKVSAKDNPAAQPERTE